MIRHLTKADYRTMPWANGLGQTVEMIRVEGDQGLLWRLSMASVVEDGDFSIFPGIERNLTVPALAVRLDVDFPPADPTTDPVADPVA